MKRIQFDISDEDAKTLKNLVRESRAASMAEVIRHALNLYKFFIREAKKGGRIQVLDSEQIIKEPIIPGINS